MLKICEIRSPFAITPSAAVHCSALDIAQVDGGTRVLSEHTQCSKMLRRETIRHSSWRRVSLLTCQPWAYW